MPPPNRPALNSKLKAAITAVVIFAVFATVLALLAPLTSGISGWPGLLFWVCVAILAAAAPVRMAGGTVVDVTSAPVIAAAALGGPAAAAVIAIGTIELREIRGLFRLRGGIPWYGTLYNHASIAVPGIAAAVVMQVLMPSGFTPSNGTLVAVVAAGLCYVAINNILTAVAIGLREERSIMAVLRANIRQLGVSLAGLAPLAWLMAAMYVVAGPIGVLPFAVPLYATRAGYKKVVEIRDMFTQTVRSLASAVDAKDPYTAGHSVRVQLIAKDLGKEMRCSDGELEALEWGGLLHDIGKIGIPDAILLKQGSLTKEERMAMNAHPVKGEEIIRPVQKLAPELPIIRHHHEWFNGSGYPDRLVGHNIPKLARILHVADSFEAMTAARPYRMTPLSEDHALQELRKYSGIQFDPEIVEAFERLIARRPDWAKPNIPEHLTHRHIPLLGEPEALPA
ncbi:MAG: HD-GYP domain-containing protein [Candidatus Limnocylindrales bacterium]